MGYIQVITNEEGEILGMETVHEDQDFLDYEDDQDFVDYDEEAYRADLASGWI